MPETIVEVKPRPRNRVFIRLSGGRFFTVPQSETNAFVAGASLTDEEIAGVSRVDQYLRGRDKALHLIGIRPRTRHEIRIALEKLGVTPSVREGIVEELIEQGLLDDVRFAREFVRSRVEMRAFGPHRLRFELGKLGVSAAVVDETLRSEITAEAQIEAARGLVRRRLGARRPDERDARRLADLLKRKGFDYDVVNRVTYELLRTARLERDPEEDSPGAEGPEDEPGAPGEPT